MLVASIVNIVPDVIRVVDLRAPDYKFHPLQIPSPPRNIDEIDEFDKERTVFPKDTKPAITPLPDILFKAQDDAETLHKALEGIGTDEQTIIRILTKRSLEQRLQIAEAYKNIFGFVLSYHLVLETSGKFAELLNALFTPLPLLYARDLQSAISGLGTTENDLIEIICSLTNHDIHAVKRTYKAVFKTNLEDDIYEDTSEQFQELLLTLLKGNRSEELVVHPFKAKEDVKRLLQAIDHNKNSGKEFLKMITSVSLPQLAAICHKFQNMAGYDIEDYIRTEFNSDVKNALLAIVEVARDGYPSFFARRLHRSMNGFGTDDKQLIRIMVTRSEIDLHDIAIDFRKRYKERLATWIEDDCSGDYRLCLLCILGAKELSHY